MIDLVNSFMLFVLKLSITCVLVLIYIAIATSFNIVACWSDMFDNMMY